MDLPGEGTAYTVETYPTRAAWLVARARGIGGSDAPAVWGVSPFASRLSLWAEKRGLQPPQDEAGEHLEIGAVIEPAIVELYARRRPGWRVLRLPPHTLLRSIARPWLTYSADAVVDAGTWGVLEVKNRSIAASADWREGPPLAVQCQLQHGLAVTGWSWGATGVLIGGNVTRFAELDRDDAWIAEHLAACEALLGAIESGEPPAPDASEASEAALQRLFPAPADAGAPIALVPEYEARAQELYRLRREIEALDARARAAANELRVVIGRGRQAIGPEGWRVTRTRETNVLQVRPPKGAKG